LLLFISCGDKPKEEKQAASCSLPPSTAEFKETARVKGFTTAHNLVRRPLGLKDLIWDENLAAYASVWAKELAQKNNCKMKHRPQGSGGLCKQIHGENLAWNLGYQSTPQRVTNAWAQEVHDYNYATNSCKPGKACGHYTQIVWKTTTHLGCAMYSCENQEEIWVCNYSPPGNFIGQKPY